MTRSREDVSKRWSEYAKSSISKYGRFGRGRVRVFRYVEIVDTLLSMVRDPHSVRRTPGVLNKLCVVDIAANTTIHRYNRHGVRCFEEPRRMVPSVAQILRRVVEDVQLRTIEGSDASGPRYVDAKHRNEELDEGRTRAVRGTGRAIQTAGALFDGELAATFEEVLFTAQTALRAIVEPTAAAAAAAAR